MLKWPLKLKLPPLVPRLELSELLALLSDQKRRPIHPLEHYPISPTRFHWESQSVTRADSETGRRYQEHESRGWRMLLFVRQNKRDDRGETMPYLFLGPSAT